MANVVILGAGVMGTAMSVPLTDNGHAVRLVGTHLDSEIIEEIRESRRHPKLGIRVADTVQPFTLDYACRGNPHLDIDVTRRTNA